MTDEGQTNEQTTQPVKPEQAVSERDLIDLLMSERKMLIERGRTIEAYLIRRQAITRALILPARER